MRDNRDMFYSNYQAGGYQEPNFMPMQMQAPMQPSGYNIQQNYQAYGPNVMPMTNQNMNNVTGNQTTTNNYIDEYDSRITKLERQMRRIDQRLRKLENANIGSNIEEEINIDSNMYMI